MKGKILAESLATFTAILIFSTCTKIDSTDIGNGLIPPVDNVKTFDTVLDVITDNFLLADSSRVKSAEDHALGAILNDPEFGKTTAAIYFNLRPTEFGKIPFADSILTLDSLVLSLAYTGSYGDSFSVEKFNVYEILAAEKDRFKDSSRGYRIDDNGFALDNLLQTHIQDFTKLNDEYSIREGADTARVIKNQMRIRLNNSFGQRFLDYDTTVYKKDSSFHEKFVGLAIIPDSTFAGSNALAYFNLSDGNNTRLTFYYKATKNGKQDTLATSFTFTNNANANIVKRNFIGTPYQTNIENGITNDDKLYIQTSPGSYSSIQVPGLSGMSNRVIHRAELIVEKLPSLMDDKFTPPDILFLDVDSGANRYITLPNDFAYTLSDGFYNIQTVGGTLKNNLYIFNISRYVQGIVTRKEKNHRLRLYAPYKTNPTQILTGGGSITPFPASALSGVAINIPVAKGRVIVAGGSYPDPQKKMRIRIIYSRI